MVSSNILPVITTRVYGYGPETKQHAFFSVEEPIIYASEEGQTISFQSEMQGAPPQSSGSE